MGEPLAPEVSLDRDGLKLVLAALQHAAKPETPPALSSQVDREAIERVETLGGLDEFCAEVPLELVAALIERLNGRLDGTDPLEQLPLRRDAWRVLDWVRRKAFLTRIAKEDSEAWSDRILALVATSNFTVGPMFRQRADAYGYKVLFELARRGGGRSVTWLQASSRVDFLARGLISLDNSDSPAPVAILSENSLEMALVDLACLTGGLINVMIPANSTEADVAFMLKHSGCGTVITSGSAQLKKLLPQREALPQLKRIISIGPISAEERMAGVSTLDELMARAIHIPGSIVTRRSEAIRIDDLATIMYTSGTTGVPKGIKFSHRNLVTKRFARALALPEIGDQDVFVCFLPLYHTFGRYLEMLGSVFWGATYCFVDNPSVEALVQAMRNYRPTVFISVPKKWIQLYEEITQKVDPIEGEPQEQQEATRQVVGDRLRWGLSAAGYLDPDIFRFFQRNGVELMSGFGMTEATGGITMTPPGEYEQDSLGGALPGIEIKLADDGELLVRGSYVMLGYLDPPEGETDLDEDGWFRTGDLMEMDARGHIRLIDRKKEIYKNVKGETIAPQRVENLFRDFPSVGRVFLVGDHKEYNTLLLYPNPNFDEVDFAEMSASDLREHFRSLVVSVNKFLAPYERIVDFAIIERDLSEEHGELTPKGSPRRKKIADNFVDTIRSLYRRASLKVGGIHIRFPNWLLQEVGLTAQDLTIEGDALHVPSRGSSLIVRSLEEGIAQIGDFRYRHDEGPINLGRLLTTPDLWLGNGMLVDFIPLSLASRHRVSRSKRSLEWAGRADASGIKPATAVEGDTVHLLHIDAAARAVHSDNDAIAIAGIKQLGDYLDTEQESLLQPARRVLMRTCASPSLDVARAGFRELLSIARPAKIRETLEAFLGSSPELLNFETIQAISEKGLSPSRLFPVLHYVHARALDPTTTPEFAFDLIRWVSLYGSEHPTSYRQVRSLLTRLRLFAPRTQVKQRAREAYLEMRDAFRNWLGETSRIAVDPDTRREYRWKDVATFGEEIPQEDCERILSALTETPFLREAIFLLSFGAIVRLSDIPLGGVGIRRLGARHGKAVFRMSVQTRFQGTFDVAINMNHAMDPREVLEEIQLLLLCGDPRASTKLVEDFGGHYPDQDLWSEEFVTGETLDRALTRLSRYDDHEDRLPQLWPFLAWSALCAYIDVWDRSGRRWNIDSSEMSNVIVPTQDYQRGARVVSVHRRSAHRDIGTLLSGFRNDFIGRVEARFPYLAGLVTWSTIFSAFVEIVGRKEGLKLLSESLDSIETQDPGSLRAAYREFESSVERRGFLPLRLFFAIKRYRRWNALTHATREAQARTLHQLYETYGLQRLARAYPDVRVRFFLEKVFRESDEALVCGLEALSAEIRKMGWTRDEIIDGIANLRSRLQIGEEDDYFLARVSFPYLRPEDAAGFVSSYSGGRPQSEMVVALEDSEGRPFRVRHALSPKEVERLHRLFLAARLDVQFLPDHQYLVALNERNQIIGGIFYQVHETLEAAHLEKIVVGDAYRRQGVADGLMNQLFNRLRATGVTTVTTGFFRPEYFYRFGFKVERNTAGLVKKLLDAPPPS